MEATFVNERDATILYDQVVNISNNDLFTDNINGQDKYQSDAESLELGSLGYKADEEYVSNEETNINSTINIGNDKYCDIGKSTKQVDHNNKK